MPKARCPGYPERGYTALHRYLLRLSPHAFQGPLVLEFLQKGLHILVPSAKAPGSSELRPRDQRPNERRHGSDRMDQHRTPATSG